MIAGLRSAEEQLWLSRLSQAPAVRLVASVDHVNAALLWNSRVAAAFNWLWVDGTTYATYEAETAGVVPIITSEQLVFPLEYEMGSAGWRTHGCRNHT